MSVNRIRFCTEVSDGVERVYPERVIDWPHWWRIPVAGDVITFRDEEREHRVGDVMFAVGAWTVEIWLDPVDLSKMTGVRAFEFVREHMKGWTPPEWQR